MRNRSTIWLHVLAATTMLLSSWELSAEEQLKGTRAGEVRDDNGLKLKLAWCPPGKFLMGIPATEKNRRNSEDPVPVTLTQGFWLGVYEVTQEQYQQVMGTNPSEFSEEGSLAERVDSLETGDFPVENVSWLDATDFVQSFTARERTAGRLPETWEYTLPTEAQWEYACRAGTESPFSFGESLNGDKANCNGRHPYKVDLPGPFLNRTTAVGSYGKNPWGLYDMHGNVEEWCLDAYQKKLPGGADPWVTRHAGRVLRGGAWSSAAASCRSGMRSPAPMNDSTWASGFRVALCPNREPRGE